MTEDLRYPVGKFQHDGEITAEQRQDWIRDIEQLPGKLAAAIHGLTAQQLDTPYRDGGWTVRQVAHHLADSHMNAFIRMKLALTEEQPTIKPYEEGAWAALPDSVSADPQISVELLNALHARWVILLRNMTDADYAATFFHPGSGQVVRLDRTLGMYAWHSRHHVAHITSLSERMSW